MQPLLSIKTKRMLVGQLAADRQQRSARLIRLAHIYLSQSLKFHSERYEMMHVATRSLKQN